ncbi:MAG: beta-galactosidase trimerization domain-containing protein, partial [Ginsengibacter sp.]
RDDPFKVGNEKNKATDWAEFIIPETAKALAAYDDPFFGKYPAITENKFGKGSFIYEGCLISDEIQSKIIADKAKEIGLVDDKQIVYPVVARSGINDQGKTIRYYLNYSDKEQSVIYNFDKGTDLLTNKALKKGDSLSLKPWDVLIVEE